MNFASALGKLPLIAILRGVRPAEVADIADALIGEGFAIIEVPLNSPDAYDSIATLTAKFGTQACIGAGTVLTTDAVARCAQAGAALVLAPNMDVSVIAEARRRDLTTMPGVATASEAIAALAAGADSLKLFPAGMLGAGTIAAWREILPRPAPIIAVGGISADNLREFMKAGAAGAGIGGALYRPGMTPAEVAAKARQFRLSL